LDNAYKPRVRDLPQEEKPREKLRLFGSAALKNYELLAVILGKGTKKEGVLELSKRIMEQYGNQALLSEKDVDKVEQMLGLSPVQACQVVAAIELGRRQFGEHHEVFLRSPREVFEYARDMSRLKKENLRGLYLDVRNKLLRDETISIGTLDASLACPRDVFLPAIEAPAASVILLHNHPSGDPSPSKDDIELTKQIYAASKILAIEILDHVIIGNGSYVSLKEKTNIWNVS